MSGRNTAGSQLGARGWKKATAGSRTAPKAHRASGGRRTVQISSDPERGNWKRFGLAFPWVDGLERAAAETGEWTECV